VEASADARLVFPRVDMTVLFYYMAGPYIGIGPYAKVHANINENPWWKLEMGLNGRVGIKVKALELLSADFKSDYNKDTWWPLQKWQAKGAFFDKTKPVTTVAGADEAWHNQPVRLTFSATDNVKVARTEYSIDGGAWKTGSAVTVPAPLGATVKHAVRYRSVDSALNEEVARTCHVYIDTVAPSCAASATDEQWKAPTPPTVVTFTGTDNTGGSGVAYTQYAVDNQYSDHVLRWQTGSSVAVSQTGANPVHCRAVDNAGNVGAEGPVRTVRNYDGTAPTTTAANADKWSNAAVTVTLSATDDAGGAGLAYTEYSLDGGATWIRGTSFTVAAPANHSNDGRHPFKYRSVDLATPANVETAKDGYAGIDTTAPESMGVLQGLTPPYDLRFQVSELHSGVAYTEYHVPAGPWIRASVVSPYVRGTRYSFRSVDLAGNVETPVKEFFEPGPG
jgi:hypothetical protein